MTYPLVLSIVAERHGLTPLDLQARCRKPQITVPRQLCTTIANAVLRLKLHQAAEPFGQNHSTLLNGIRHIAALYTTDRDFRSRVDAILDTLATNDTFAWRIERLKAGLSGDDKALQEARHE